jgi:hypothetical protein
MRNSIILVLICCTTVVLGQRSATEIPVHSIHGGFFATTSGAKTGIFLDYQYYTDDQISYSLKPGMTGLSGDKDTSSYFLFAGMNYRFTALRKPLRKRPINTQPYTGFYPLSFEYVKWNPLKDEASNFRLGIVPSGIIGYTLIFYNRIDLDMHAGFGVSFRMGGGHDAGSAVEPKAFAGIALGVRL